MTSANDGIVLGTVCTFPSYVCTDSETRGPRGKNVEGVEEVMPMVYISMHPLVEIYFLFARVILS